MLRIAVFGAGHLGKIHIALLQESPYFHLVGFYDSDIEHAQRLAAELGINYFVHPNELIEQADVIDIVTPTLSHHAYACLALRNSKHVFIEKPITSTVEEAREIINLAEEAGCKVAVGHVERFNPAFRAAASSINTPMFIEAHRLAQFNPRGTDVSVVLDLMIHDIDIVLKTVGSSVKKIHASGVSIVSSTPDIANARIEFDNGCVANLTASRLSMKNMRKTRFFQHNAYISVDFLEKEAEIIRINPVEGEADPLSLVIKDSDNKPIKEIYFEKPEIITGNAIKDELESFAHAIMQQKNPIVSASDGLAALEVAYKIIEKMNHTNGLTA
ncbi:MAG: Gfo/Idh/MocA family protein [Bacteroidia bacterium]|jgi:predicted dehydrogenase